MVEIPEPKESQREEMHIGGGMPIGEFLLLIALLILLLKLLKAIGGLDNYE